MSVSRFKRQDFIYVTYCTTTTEMKTWPKTVYLKNKRR